MGITLSKQELESKLWQAADILRGQIDAADYKNYIFSIMFLKRLSDRFNEEVESAVALGVPREAALSDPDEHEFFVPEEARWPALTGASMNLGEVLNTAGYEIETENVPRLDGVLTPVNWNDESKLGSPANREKIIRNLLNHFSGLDLSDHNLTGGGGAGEGARNVLGDAYEYLIHQFADDAGKKGGEFYTPRGVVRLIVELLRPKEGMRICDPTAGSAGMLIYTAHYVAEHGGNSRNLVLDGQERNLGTLAIGKLNLLLHNLLSARLEPGDVIADPQLLDEDNWLLTYDRVIANPPFSLKNWGHEVAQDDDFVRFNRYGAIPPKTRGDLAFLLHMLAVTKPTGMVGVVMPHGVLFRGGAEGKIRRGILEDDLFEAIIGLVPNLFYGASIPVVICLLNKDKPPKRRGRVLFINADQEGFFHKTGPKNSLDQEHIDKIAAVYHEFKEVERFAHIADIEEIKANDFNLNISRYVDTTAPVEVISVEEALTQLRRAEKLRDEAVAKMNDNLKELGYV